MKGIKTFLKSFGTKKKSYVLRQLAPGGISSGKAWWSWKEGVRTQVGKYKMLSKRQEVFKNAIEGKLRVQSRASERLQDQIIEEIKELENTKDRRSFCNWCGRE